MAGNLTTGTSVTARVFSVLYAFDEQHVRLPLSSIARRAGLPLPTTHRLVAALVQQGALSRDGRNYVIGRRLWDLGLLAPVQSSLREAASPFLHDIYAATLATVHLAVRDDHAVLYLDTLRGRSSVPVVSQIGSTLPMHATGVGKVLLAHSPADVQARVCADLTAITRYTITAQSVLRAELLAIRRDGYATTTEEMTLGACSVAVPIEVQGQVVAALGVVVASLARSRGRLIAALQVAAQGIARTLLTGGGSMRLRGEHDA